VGSDGIIVIWDAVHLARMEGKYNPRSPAVKRLMKEAAELSRPTADYQAAPLEENLFEWHFTVRGPSDTDFEGGIYHGRILVPADYPMKPPDIIILTPNGRFEVGKKICLSISGHHPETWQPSWSIRTALLAIIGFMPSPAQGTIGSLDYTPEERRILARRSQNWSCPVCGPIAELLAPPEKEQNLEQDKEVKEIVEGLQLKGEEKEVQEAKKEAADDQLPPPSASSASQDPVSGSSRVGDPSPPASTVSSPPDTNLPVPATAAGSATPVVSASAASPSTAAAPSVTTAASTSQPAPRTGAQPSASASRLRRTRAAQARPNQESVGPQVYDLCIMLVVAAIAALLYRRFNVMQTGDDNGLGD